MSLGLSAPDPPRQSEDPTRRRLDIAVALLSCVSVVALVWSHGRGASKREPPTSGPLVRLTATPASELSPSLSPDGRWVAYVSDATGNTDIYRQPTSGGEPINLTSDSPVEDTSPAISPDGQAIAFRSMRGGAGIFVMAQDGSGAERVATFGFDPAWTPDGRTIVYATQDGRSTERIGSPSEGWRVEVSSRLITRIAGGDFRQPAVSPHGRRIAYWSYSMLGFNRGIAGRQSEIWTVRLDGREPVRVIGDGMPARNPVWSADGRYLYFVRGIEGAEGLWRVGIDERSGRPLGRAVAIQAPALRPVCVAASANGQSLAWASLSYMHETERMAFNADARAVKGAPVLLHEGFVASSAVEPSPDGSMLVFTSAGAQEDIYVSRADGSDLRRLTDDAAADRQPHWSPDGRRILFQSDRGGDFGLWMMNADGTGERLFARAVGDLIDPIWSPDGTRIAARDDREHRALVFDANSPDSEPLETLPPFVPEDFRPHAWSPDGRAIVGTGAGAVWVYSLETHRSTRIASGDTPIWLNDSRLLLYAVDGRLYMADATWKYTREILAMPGADLRMPRLSRDQRQLYFSRGANGGDIWLMRLQ